ncbi:dipeptide/oligopeptide/nickel ABC transporter permease/ATP-binding protein [Nonomuraea guangzhouensis]|uniref:Dipeptide/oligopeptide/nickel ABC transporter permease/ATP-binding protein n=1 Tax=Nonomuraea guangzhouensis TaxID=1291555 RepID=A0ABW4G7Z9_9ACTN|nr:dipeptide/oligopeptide/nickel ABC transporter permease/ATP-binding protein [Nonomuraea guangzhouensis]
MTEKSAPPPFAAPLKRDHLMRRTLRDPAALGGLAVLVLVAAAGAAAPLLSPYGPDSSALSAILAPRSAAHPLGGDGVGRDVLARLLYGGRTSLIGGAIAVLVAFAIGGPLGLVAGFHRGWVDAAARWVNDVIMAVPAIIVMLAVMVVISQDLNVAMAVLGVIVAPLVFRLIRASVMAVREELYIDAARVSGLGEARILRRHVLPMVIAPSVSQAAQLFAIAIGIQAGLGFLGLGKASQASWGAMLNDAFTNVYNAPILLLWPGVTMAATIVAFGLLGTSIRDAMGGDDTVIQPVRRGPRPHTAAPVSASVSEGERPLLAVDDLRVTYARPDGDRTVVDGVSLTIHRGEVLGLVGESGSGKSQTAFAVLGLLPPQARVGAERLEFDGTDLTRLGDTAYNRLRGRRVGYIPQEPMSNLDPSFRIGFQLVEPMRRHLGLSSAGARDKALALLERVGIPDPMRVFRSYPHQISGGMAQRVLIAGAVSCDPDLLIADEPTTALDVTVQAEVLDLMRSLQQEQRMGMLIVTHDLGVVADICDRVAVMRTGKVVETASARELFHAPRHPYTRTLLDSTLEGAEPRKALSAPSQIKDGSR